MAALNSAPVQAELTGIGLKEVCDSSELACISYVRGFIEGVGIRGLMLMGPENFRMPWCATPQVTVQQMTLVVEKYPLPQNRQPQYCLRIAGNSRCTLNDERPFILRTRSLIASFGGTDTNICT